MTKISDDEVEALLSTVEGHFVDLKSVDIAPSRVSDAVNAAYQDFFNLWKDADPDPDIPILKEAKAEYTKLQ